MKAVISYPSHLILHPFRKLRYQTHGVILFLQNWQALEQIPNEDLYFVLLAVVMTPVIQCQNGVLV